MTSDLASIDSWFANDALFLTDTYLKEAIIRVRERVGGCGRAGSCFSLSSCLVTAKSRQHSAHTHDAAGERFARLM